MSIKQKILLGGFCAISLGLLYSLNTIILPFFLGFIGAYIFTGLVSKLESVKIPRGISSAVVLLGVILFVVILISVAFPYLQQQLLNFVGTFPQLVDSSVNYLRPFLAECAEKFGTPDPSEIKNHLSSHVGDILTWFVRFMTGVVSSSVVLANTISLVFLTPIIMFYLLKDWPRLVACVDGYVPMSHRPSVYGYVRQIDTALSGYAKGQSLVCLILMVLYALSLWTLGLNQGVFVGVLTGFLSFIPYVGAVLGFLTAITLAFAQDSGLILPLICIFLGIAAIESNFLSPRLIGDKVGVHPVWIIFALLAGATWFGFLGVLFALPAAAVTGVIIRLLGQAYRSSFSSNPLMD